MSTSRAKQIAQKRKSKTKRSGSGAKYAYAKKKSMRQLPEFLLKANNKSKRNR